MEFDRARRFVREPKNQSEDTHTCLGKLSSPRSPKLDHDLIPELLPTSGDMNTPPDEVGLEHVGARLALLLSDQYEAAAFIVVSSDIRRAETLFSAKRP